ncbi:suppressor of cytokine signaling 3-like isoform X1 [Nerophis lumbriciformis]|uniref:suppressor of cytokine signaling 3-like isoform X1 n=2 Tax=Nerophis lumbriciformis TaxID=546530 RepID=UPI002AE0327E|nr:suppressor of cytokine signaling 3-like isoform X1 [Nerophis lumbriciformis]
MANSWLFFPFLSIPIGCHLPIVLFCGAQCSPGLRTGHSAMVTLSKCYPAMSSSHSDSPNVRLPQRYKTFASKAQYQMVLATLHKLKESGFYWGAITGKEANALLGAENTGTFLVRDSSDNRHLFTLSIKTASGTKNLRVQCDAASFYLQTDPKNIHLIPHFDCILKLVHYYMPQSKGNTRTGNVDYIYTGGEKVPLELVKPLACSLSTLQHLCRKTVNGHLDISSKRDQLPHPLREFLQDYDAPI